MNMENALIKFQRMLNQTWQAHGGGILSQNEFDYLACIYEAENAEPPQDPTAHDDSTHLSALAEQMQVKKSSASLMVNKLEKRGLIERVTCMYDARAQHILLTEQGREIYRQTRNRIYGGFIESLEKKLDKSDGLTFKRLINALTENQQEAE